MENGLDSQTLKGFLNHELEYLPDHTNEVNHDSDCGLHPTPEIISVPVDETSFESGNAFLPSQAPFANGWPQPVGELPGAAWLSHTAPYQQKNAIHFLAGDTPGVMRHYAPGAKTDPKEGMVETDETVEKQRHIREEYPYG